MRERVAASTTKNGWNVEGGSQFDYISIHLYVDKTEIDSLDNTMY